MLNDVAPGASLRILKGNTVVWERARPETPPRLEKVAAATLDEKGQLTIQWTLDDRTKEQGEVWIRWSNDDGRTWMRSPWDRKDRQSWSMRIICPRAT